MFSKRIYLFKTARFYLRTNSNLPDQIIVLGTKTVPVHCNYLASPTCEALPSPGNASQCHKTEWTPDIQKLFPNQVIPTPPPLQCKVFPYSALDNLPSECRKSNQNQNTGPITKIRKKQTCICRYHNEISRRSAQ